MKRYVIVIEKDEHDGGDADRYVESVYGPFAAGETVDAQDRLREEHGGGKFNGTVTIVPLTQEMPK